MYNIFFWEIDCSAPLALENISLLAKENILEDFLDQKVICIFYEDTEMYINSKNIVQIIVEESDV